MILYNVTVHVDNDIHDEWLSWMRSVHIPEVMATGMFSEHRMLKVLTDDDAGTSYAIQYTCDSMEIYHRYRDEFAPGLQKQVLNKYGDKCVAFRTLLEIL